MRERFDQLLQQAQDDFAAGDLGGSAALFAEAESLALEHGEVDLADRAFCNRCAVAIELDEAGQLIPRLKQILLRSSDTKTRWLAAYYSAVASDLDDDAERAASYSARAFELAEELGEPEPRAGSANLVGNLAMRSSRFAEAERAFSQALACHPGLDGHQPIMRAQVRDNLGYVLMCTGRVEEGVRLCEEARATLEQLRATHYLHQTLQDLCYGYLLSDDLERAQRNGERALELASSDGDALVVKNCLFLLSETAVRSGDPFRARRYLRELAAHYPEVGVSEEIIDVFLVTDLTQVVNLRG